MSTSSDPEASISPTELSATAIRPIPAPENLDERVVELGRRLFHEARLSRDGTISCASCHDLAQGGDDGRRVSIGVGGAKGERNAPTVLNSSLNFRQFWDGRAVTLEEQAGGPLIHPDEMGSTWSDVIATLQSDTSYVAEFRELWPDGVTQANVRLAIATFERSLLTPGGRFDRFLGGEKDALTPVEKEGYELFLEVGCITCHQGVNVGGNLHQRFGQASNFFVDRGGATVSDLGRYNVTNESTDAFKFKVPTLRNVARTAPYFHDGSVPTLEQAVRIMAKYQLGDDLEESEIEKIAAFLRTLDGPNQD